MAEIDKIYELAKEKGIKTSFICSQIGKNESYLRQIKAGKSNIPENILIQIADILDTTTDYLQGKTDKKEKPDVNVELSEKEKRILSIIRTLSPEDVNRLEAIADSLRRLK